MVTQAMWHETEGSPHAQAPPNAGRRSNCFDFKPTSVEEPPAMVRPLRLLPLLAVLGSLVWGAGALGERPSFAWRESPLLFGSCALLGISILVTLSIFHSRKTKKTRASSAPASLSDAHGDNLGESSSLSLELADDRLREIWSAERLARTLRAHLRGDEDVVVVANREPYIHERIEGGKARVLHPASGLVTALEPVMHACSGVWIGHGSGSADREHSDRRGRVRVPPGEGAYLLRRVWLSREEEKGYYYGFSNEGLWPLCHLAHTRPSFDASDFAQYRRVNRKFADAVCEEATSDDPVVFVQDYHFALLPRMIRERLPRATILTFWHIPWPNAERFDICPWREELLDGLLGSSILGFQTQKYCNNFLDSVDEFLEARIDREERAVVLGGASTLVRPYPISIDWPNRWAEGAPSVEECRRAVREELGVSPNILLGIGVDRLDYTKGFVERLLAIERLLEKHRHLRGRFTFVQIAAPSRTAIASYRDLHRNVEAIVERVNRKFGRGEYLPIIFLREHHEPSEVFRHYRAADVCYVSSLHDGMNLVAKEFVAARDDEKGVLVLSRFTGAARELTEALIVNPYDIDAAANALAQALAMLPGEQTMRMRAMRARVAEQNVYRWAARIFMDAARLRQRDRLVGKLERRDSRFRAGASA